ncbi:MAG: alcohol dehydrogenase [Phycisphaerales bacterium]|nr:MAG: alcohol dehydrogenase [Phycisphaerales bacterium]
MIGRPPGPSRSGPPSAGRHDHPNPHTRTRPPKPTHRIQIPEPGPTESVRAIQGATALDAIVARQHKPTLEHTDAPTLAPGQALVRVRLAGEVPAAAVRSARLGPDGTVLGRDLVGVVVDVADDAPQGVRDRLLRARVVCSPFVACGQCDMCRSGVSQHCREGGVMGSAGLAGSLAQTIAVPWRNLAPVPDGLDDQAALLAGPLARAVHAARMIRMEGKVYVTVLGDNLAALLAVQAIARLNATVRLLGWNPQAFGRAERWGLQHRHAHEVGRRKDQTVVVDCVASHESLDLALGMLRPRGTLILAAEPPDPLPLDLAAVVRGELELIGASFGHVADALPLLAQGQVDTTGLVEVRTRPNEAPRLLARTELLYVAVEFAGP